MSESRTSGATRALAPRLAELLRAFVSVVDPQLAGSKQFRHFDSAELSVLTLDGGPMQINKAPSSCDGLCVWSLQTGQATLRHGTGSVSLKAGQFLICRATQSLELVQGEPCDMVVVRLSATASIHALAPWLHAEFVPIQGDAEGRIASGLARELAECGSTLHSERSLDVAVEAIVRLVSHAITAASPARFTPSPAEHHRQRVRQYCQQHLRFSNLSISSVADALGLSRAHVHRLFRHEPTTLKAWIQQERLKAARAEIEADLAGAKTLMAIALAYGFEDAGHFSRAFKRRFGMPPRQLRAQVLARRG